MISQMLCATRLRTLGECSCSVPNRALACEPEVCQPVFSGWQQRSLREL